MPEKNITPPVFWVQCCFSFMHVSFAYPRGGTQGQPARRNLPSQSPPDQVLLKEYPEIVHCQSHHLHTTLCILNLSLSLKISQPQFHAKKR